MDKLSLKNLFREIKSFRKECLHAHGIALLHILISVPIPLLIPTLLDEVVLDKDGWLKPLLYQMVPETWDFRMSSAILVFLLVVILRLASLVLNVAQEREFNKIAKAISFKYRRKVIHCLEQLQLRHYEDRGAGALSSRCVSDVQTLEHLVSGTMSKLLISVLSILGTALVLIWINPLLATIIICLNPIVIVFSKRFSKKVGELKRKENLSLENFQQSLMENLGAIEQLRVLNWQKNRFNHSVDRAEDWSQSSLSSQWRSSTYGKLSFTTFLLGFEFFRISALFLVMSSQLSIGQMFAVFAYLWFMMGPVQEVINIQYAFYAAKAAISRLNELFELEAEPQCDEFSDPFKSGQIPWIHFKDLSFSYAQGQSILKKVSFSIQPKQTLALVSTSGSGKSTISRLLLRLYEHDQGQILIDNTPIQKIDPSHLRSHISMSLQSPTFFQGSVWDNLCSHIRLPEPVVWEALRRCEMESVVKKWPDGLNSSIGLQGVKMSGGQRQRLSLARMILSDASIWILDEATSALDRQTEQRLYENLAPLMKDRSVVMISHRLETIQRADTIVVLNDGEIEQRGHHDALMTEQGLYRTLFSD